MAQAITLEIIEQTYASVLSECSEIRPISEWVHTPSGVTLTDRKTKYGLAEVEGLVLISQAYLNTTSHAKLDQTLRHEFAHLAVGVDHNHDRVFKRCLSAFRGDKAVPEEERDAIIRNISYKWHVLAHLVDGRQFVLGGVHRKTKVYSEHHINREQKRAMYHKEAPGVPVERFEFQLNN